MVEDNLWWKTTFGGRQPLVEDDLRWKTTFIGRRLSVEGDLLWKTTFCGRHPLLDPCMLASPLCSIFSFRSAFIYQLPLPWTYFTALGLCWATSPAPTKPPSSRLSYTLAFLVNTIFCVFRLGSPTTSTSASFPRVSPTSFLVSLSTFSLLSSLCFTWPPCRI